MWESGKVTDLPHTKHDPAWHTTVTAVDIYKVLNVVYSTGGNLYTYLDWHVYLTHQSFLFVCFFFLSVWSPIDIALFGDVYTIPKAYSLLSVISSVKLKWYLFFISTELLNNSNEVLFLEKCYTNIKCHYY